MSKSLRAPGSPIRRIDRPTPAPSIVVHLVEGEPYASENEALASARALALMRNCPVPVLRAEIPVEHFEQCQTVNPVKPVPGGTGRATPATKPDLSGLATDPESAACLEVEGFGMTANPLAVALLHQQGWFADVCRFDGAAVSVEVNTVRGIVDAGPRGMRPATDTEAAGMEAAICVRTEKAFDSRNPLPRPIAKWLRAMADQIHAELNEAAGIIESTKDDRDRDLVRRWVQRDPAIKFNRLRGLVDVEAGAVTSRK